MMTGLSRPYRNIMARCMPQNDWGQLAKGKRTHHPPQILTDTQMSDPIILTSAAFCSPFPNIKKLDINPELRWGFGT